MITMQGPGFWLWGILLRLWWGIKDKVNPESQD